MTHSLPAWFFFLLVYTVHQIKCLNIIPDETELIMPRGSSIALTCSHDEPIEWIYGLFDNSEENETKKTVTSELVNGTYTKVLTISNLNHMDTAYYICSGISDNELFKRIYIFVRDDNNLLVSDQEFNIIHHSPADTLIIPCKPTSPNVNVTLSYDGQNSNDFVYDNKIGFKAQRKFTTALDFTCAAVSPSNNQEVIYELLISAGNTDLPTPMIELNGNQNKNSVIIGQKVVLKCSVQVDVAAMIYLFWEVPKKVDMNIDDSVKHKYLDLDNVKIGSSVITIDRVNKDHEGLYKCFVQDQSDRKVSANYTLQVLASDVNYLDLKLTNGNSTIYVKPGSSKAYWSVTIDAHPPATYDWLGPESDALSPSQKFHITKTPTSTEVLIKGVSVVDSGVYKLVAKSGQLTKTLEVELFIEGEPFVELRMISQEYYVNDHVIIICTVLSYPQTLANITFTECDDYKTCGEPKDGKVTKYTVTKSCTSEFHCRFVAKTTATKIGYLTCSACNYLGCHWSKKIINITDVPRGLSIFKPTQTLVTNDSLLLTCGAAAYKYNNVFEWYFQSFKDGAPKLLTNVTDLTISNSFSSPFSHKSILNFTRLEKNYSGTYTCLAYDFVEKKKNSTMISIEVLDGVSPYFVDNRANFAKYRLSIGDESLWNCTISGIPTPKIYWYKNQTRISRNSSSIHMLHNNKTLKISFVKNDDAGMYKCIGLNKLGYVEAGFKLSIAIQDESLAWLWALLASLVTIAIIFFVIMVFLLRRVKHEKELRKQLAEAGLSTFLEGQTESLNPDLSMAEQANLLPYDKKWEFPRHKLHIGKQIGSGAFGVVMKGVAHGIRDNEESTIVAIKMNSDWTKVKELATELKIMAYLGQHLNVVNLLGACTANLHKKELLVIVEFCPYGNLHNYLIKHRNIFVNHLREGEVNPNVYQKFYRTKSILSTSVDTESNIQSNGTVMTQITSDGGNKPEGTENPAVTSETPIDEDGYLMNKEMEEFVKKSDEMANTPHKKIYTSDLLCYSYQIARGMEYLASRKVLHGDLAARNILLAENNIVKICDFGLAKNMYDNDNYTKSANSKLPVKWMSIEAIRDRIFSTQSDIWAYGITLWEIFSLSTTPYPGIYNGSNLFSLLAGGYRMERPAYATKDVYNLMIECWREEPYLRPSFTELSERIGNMLQEHVKQRYESLNNPYEKLNNKLYQQADYVQMFNAPNYVNVVEVSPDQVPNTPPGYLKMAKTPSIPEEEVEMTPMLKGDEH